MPAEQIKIVKNGLWSNNVALVQLLGLCPLLAVSGTFINGFGLGLATMLTLVLSNACVSVIRHWVRPEVRIPIFVLIIASIVTTIELAMNAWFHELFLVLGIFIPLIVTNCSIIARAESFASKNSVLDSVLDGFMMGLGFMLVLVILGSLREMFGEGARDMLLTLGDEYPGFLLAILPPGAFIGLGLLIALKNHIDRLLQQRVAHVDLPAESSGSAA
jgi:electron transport complex protein RnfE